MRPKKFKKESIVEKVIRGIKLGRQKMLEEKSIRGEYVVYEYKGKIKKEKASEILKREKTLKKTL